MRGFLVSLGLALIMAFALPNVVQQKSSLTNSPVVSGTVAAAQDAAPKNLDVDINVNHGGGGWHRSPMWIAIGAIAAVVVILLIAMAVRGGGTTIVKE